MPLHLPITRRRTAQVLGALAASTALLAACGDGDSTTTAITPGGTSTESSTATAGGSDATVEIERSRYAPMELTVAAGTTVEFVNLDPVDHTVTAADGSTPAFDSGHYGRGEVFEQRFDEAGTYRYFCEVHPTMRGSVLVE